MVPKLFKPLLLLLLLMSLLVGGAAQAMLPPIPAPPMPPFQLDSGHPLAQVIIPRLIPALIQDVSPTLSDVTLVPRVTATLLTAMVDALAPYHPTAVGIYTRFDRRPQDEWTLENMNIASLYAAYHSLRGMLPQREEVWLTLLTDFGLDPMVDGMDTTNAAGIGVAAGKGAVEARLYDGMNQAGGYTNSTDYAPVNTVYELVDPSRWQPAIKQQRLGTYTVQTFVTPQLANVEPYADFNPRDFRHPAPTASDAENWDDYKAQVDQILAASANLTDEQKMMAELFDNKIVALGFSFIHAAVQNQISPMDFAPSRLAHDGRAGRRNDRDLAGKGALRFCPSLQRSGACIWRRDGQRLGRSRQRHDGNPRQPIPELHPGIRSPRVSVSIDLRLCRARASFAPVFRQ